MARSVILLLSILFVSTSWAAGGNVRLKSSFSFDQTVQRYVEALKDEGIPYVHEKKIANGSEVIKFTNPYFGTNIGQCHKGVRKDKPLTATIRADQKGNVWLVYTRPVAHINDYGVIECGNETDKMTRALQKFATLATGS